MTGRTRVIVGVSGSLNSLTALHRAVGEARRRDALLVPVLAWAPPGGEAAYRRSPCAPLLQEWEQAAHERLTRAFDEAFGGYPAGVEMEPMVVRGEPGPVLVGIADRPDDLIVVNSGSKSRSRRLFQGSVSRYCVARANCAVFAVPPSELRDVLVRATRIGDPLAMLARTARAA
jgi:nucleotide-binding universal stress UspA family protein